MLSRRAAAEYLVGMIVRLLLIMSMGLPAASWAGKDWELAKESGGMRIFTREVASRGKETGHE